MCHFTDLLAGGPALLAQALTAVSIISCIIAWVLVYRWQKVRLEPFMVPVCLWILFGTLDILITARGTFDDPLREGNPLAQMIFVQSGFAGPIVASVLWISLWSAIVLAINRMVEARFAIPLSLIVFYSLAAGHLFGFSSWFLPLCPVSKAYLGILPDIPRVAKVISAGAAAAAIHLAAGRLMRR